MDGFIEMLDMREVIQSADLKTHSTNLEDIYTELHERTDCEEVRLELDKRIRDYFSELELPDDPPFELEPSWFRMPKNEEQLQRMIEMARANFETEREP